MAMNRRIKLIALLMIGMQALFLLPAVADSEIDFRQQVQPILAAKCYACHGPDEHTRAADLRLDVREAATDYGAIVEGEPEESLLVERIFETDADLIMPPPESNHTLTADEKQILVGWIKQGAEYEQHWAFVTPQQPTPPEAGEGWARNPIDRFIAAKLEQKGLTPAVEADRYTLVRRLYLDLIGLPPTPEQADAFAKSDDPDAYEMLVDELLASPHYGERWAQPWLDLARYADTNGYEKDRPRSIWPFRDWVINALNADMPFDQFTLEQLAGDMLPDATIDQLIATGFHRNTMLNEEGGIDPNEFRYLSVVDRVATTGTTWLGLTTGCAQCHTHKYDPISHTEYFELFALLNNAEEPFQIVETDDYSQKLAAHEQKLEQMVDGLADKFPPAEGEQPTIEDRLSAWIDAQQSKLVAWQTLRVSDWKTNSVRLESLEDGSLMASGDATKRDVYTLRYELDETGEPITALRLEAIADSRLPALGPGLCYYEWPAGSFSVSEVAVTQNGEKKGIASVSASAGKANAVKDGNASSAWNGDGPGNNASLVISFAEPIDPSAGPIEIEMIHEAHYVASLGRFRWSATADTTDVAASRLSPAAQVAIAKSATNRTVEEMALLRREFLLLTPGLAEARKPIDAHKKRKPKAPTTLVMRERPEDFPRQTHRHHRGEYLNPREEVAPGVPAVLLGDDTASEPTNRRELAEWLTSEANPLGDRVVVNRAWQSLFGRGIVPSADDFGTQSQPPSHPELLDWLSCEFRNQGQSFKRLHKLIVMSATYRQDSRVTKELLAADPDNVWLARGPRFRVDAELVRDIMLASSGLLNRDIGGPSVRPPQPAAVTSLAYGNPRWNADGGASRYRRSLYTFKKRTAPFAAYAVFDAPSGENCSAVRGRSNNALQSLTLLNDEMYLEMARGLARKVIGDASHETTKDYVVAMFRSLLTRPPEAEEIESLVAYFEAQHARLVAGELEPAKILARPKATEEDSNEAAAALVARALMNLDEAITKD